MKKIHKVVMLPTEKRSDICIDPTNSLYYKGRDLDGELTPIHLYFLSDEGAKEGDICLTAGRIVECKGKLLAVRQIKIIGSTDKSITPKSWIPDSFIPVYVKAYNEGKPITEVSLEMERGKQICFTDEQQYQQMSPDERDSCFESVPKTRLDGSVIIHQAKMYSREEMKNKIIDAVAETLDWSRENNNINSIGLVQDRFLNKWIEENL